MLFQVLILLIPLIRSKSILHVNEIYILNNNYQKNNFSIILSLRETNKINISKKLVINNIFNIITEFENAKEQNKIIAFECSLFYLNSSINSEIKCFLKNFISSNFIGKFYLRIENFKKSFMIQFNGECLDFTLEILEEIFYIGMIRSFRTNKDSHNLQFNYRVSDVIIPIAMSLDDGYTYPTIVAMTSILENANSNTIYDFYILHSSNFPNESKKKLKSLEKKYNRCSVNLYDMKYFLFKNATLSRYIKTLATYYRLSLSDLLPNVDKIIYLDGDTLTFDDLKKMYDIDMEGFYYKGFLDISKDLLLPNLDNYICAGVLLINLEEIRKDDIVNKMYDFMIKNNKKLYYNDQTIINGVCSSKNGILPAKFGVFNFNKLKILLDKADKIYKNKKFKYSHEELRKAYFHPSILHYTIKPWKKTQNYAKNIWLEYAKKTDYFNDIIQKYNIFKKNKKKSKKIKKKK